MNLLINIFLALAFSNNQSNCSGTFETYVDYKEFLPIYESPNGQKVGQFRFEDDESFDFGRTIRFSESSNGWLKIDHIYSKNGMDFTGKWIKSSFAFIGTRNYDNTSINLLEQPSPNSKQIGTINQESELNVLEFCNNWVLIESGKTKGWLSPDWICTNETTNCN